MEEEKRFQFLIGRLQTIMDHKRDEYSSEFQFLIGRLQTCQPVRRDTIGVGVSIPYR